MALLSACTGQLHDPHHNRSKPVLSWKRRQYLPTRVNSVRKSGVSQSQNELKRLLTSLVCLTRLHRLGPLSLTTTQRATMANTMCRGLFKHPLFTCHKAPLRITPPSITLNNGTRCHRTADHPPTICSTILIRRDLRLRRSLT